MADQDISEEMLRNSLTNMCHFLCPNILFEIPTIISLLHFYSFNQSRVYSDAMQQRWAESLINWDDEHDHEDWEGDENIEDSKFEVFF